MTKSPAKSLHELIKTWPYARDYLVDTMDPVLIEEHGRLHLSRALNVGGVVAFLSAGVSMAYGRISWRNLVEDLIKEAEISYADFAPGSKSGTVHHAGLESLAKSLKDLNPTKRPLGGDIRSDRYPALFHLCAELSTGVAAARTQSELISRPGNDNDFLAGVKTRTRDGHFHAMALLQKHLGSDPRYMDGTYPKEMKKRQREFTNIIDRVPRLTRRQLFRIPNIIENIIEADVPDWRLGRISKDKLSIDWPKCLKPSLRFILPAVLAVDGCLSPEYVEVLFERYFSKLAKYISSIEQGGNGEATPRAQVIDPASDIIGFLHSQLNIRRFLTTNYDLEVERLVHDLGFDVTQPPGLGSSVTLSIDPLGQVSRDLVVRREEAAALVDFALHDSRYKIDVAHLHGRSLKGETIVATESEYQKFYLLDDANRPLIDQSIELAFRANTLLFIGSGMGEDDILRPLRHFMSQDKGATPPPVIALLPNLWGMSTVIEEKISLLRRYGVYTIHWGRGWTADPAGKPLPDSPEPYILPSIKKLIGAIKPVLDAALTAGGGGVAAIPPDRKQKWHEELQDANTLEGGKLIEGSSRHARLRALETIEGVGRAHGEAFAPKVIETEWQALRFAFDTAHRLVEEEGKLDENEVRAARIIAAEIEDAILSAFLAAAVKRLEMGWAAWKENWFVALKPRLAVPSPLSKPDDEDGIDPEWLDQVRRERPSVLLPQSGLAIDRRSCVALPHRRQDGDPGTPDLVSDPDFLRRWSQTLAEFVDALRHVVPKPNGHRRVFFLAGKRGLGKGHLFGALTQRDAFLDYLEAADTKEVVYGLYAFNLSFSVELGSGFERLAYFVFKQIQRMYQDASVDPDTIADFEQRFGRFRARGTRTTGDRVGAIKFLFDVMAGGVPASGELRELPKPNGRVVLVFNASHLLYGPAGEAKSADVVRYMNIFLGIEYHKAAVDVLFVTSEHAMPKETRELEDPAPSATPGSASAMPGQPRDVRDRVAEDPSRPLAGGKAPRQAIHLVSIVPRGRLDIEAQEDAIAIKALRLRFGQPSPEGADREAERPAPPNREMTIPAYFHRLQQPRISVMILAPFPGVAIAIAISAIKRLDAQIGRDLSKLRLKDSPFFGRFSEPLPTGEVSRRVSRGTAAAWVTRAVIGADGGPDGNSAEFREAIDSRPDFRRKVEEEVDREFGRLYKRLGRSRICVSITCAAALEVIDDDGDVKKTLEVIDKIASSLTGLDEANREDTLIRSVIDHYRQDANNDERLAGRFPDSWPEQFRKYSNKMTSRQFFLLQEELLAALGMIGFPVEPDCLTFLDFRAMEWLDRPNPEEAGGGREPESFDGDRTSFITAALNQLVKRCLVFRFTPRLDRGAGDQPIYRYAVHRLLQRHVFRRMHQPRVEFPEVESYMPTLYASQPNDLPYPTHDAQARIRDMVARLAFYPSREGLRHAREVPDIHPERASRMLRAAYGIMRTVYSVAVVARFNAYVPAVTPPSDGFFEEHRWHVRWLLRRADELEKQLKPSQNQPEPDKTQLDVDPARSRDPEDWRDQLPFYAGDLVWLYNECGTLSLIQGHLHDAAKLFAEGLRAVQAIEAPNIGGALTNILRLNRAIVDIEMGKCRKADAVLEAVATTADEHLAVRWIATGYRGLVAHVRGDVKNAEYLYKKSIAALRSMQCYRGASIFARHLAEMYLNGSSGTGAATEEMAEDAVKLASIGNHEDIYQLARVVRLRAEIARIHLAGDGPAPGPGGSPWFDVQKQLENISIYVRVMGMPRLAVEVASLDASIRVRLGDLHNATKSVTRALSLANEKGMMLKKVDLTILLAQIYEARGMRDGARLLAESGRNLAISTEYATAQDEAQAILSRA